MRIDLNTGIVPAETSLEKSAFSHPRPAVAAPAESQFSSSEASLTNLTASVLNAPEVRQEKIEALQAQLQSRTYAVSSQSIAASLLEQMRVSG